MPVLRVNIAKQLTMSGRRHCLKKRSAAIPKTPAQA
jgi:hypothetical protein